MSLPELKIRIGAGTEGAEKGIETTKRGMRSLGSEMAGTARSAAAFGAKLSAAFTAVKAAALAAGVAAARTATEIANQARVANTSTTTLQKWAAAARTVGVEQEKVADILKDVTDKVGEFLSTGGGPMTDFFDNIAPKVGVTAEQFARLSGPEALQLYVSSLEKAGLTQQQMTFYLETMSGDLTKMLPLLRNGGTEIQRLGDEAERAGRIIDDDMIRGGVEMDRVFGDIADTLKTSATKAVLEHKDEIIALAKWVAETLIPALSALLTFFLEMAQKLQPVLEFWKALAGYMAAAAGIEAPSLPGEMGGGAQAGPDEQARIQADIDDAKARDRKDLQILRVDENGSVEVMPGSGMREFDADGRPIGPDGTPFGDKPLPEIVIPSKPDKGKGKGGGGGGGKDRDLKSRLERMREDFAAEQELLQEQFDQRLEALRLAREAELLTEEEYAEMKLQAQKDFNDKSSALDQAAMQAKLQAWSSALGDLAGLMSSGNKKLFQIGKVAAIAQAVVDGWSSAISAYKKGSALGGPALGAVFAATSIAKTGSMIASLSATQADGGGGGARGAGSASVPAGAAAAETGGGRVANYQISGDVLGKQSTEELFRSINEGIKDGYSIHNVEWV